MATSSAQHILNGTIRACHDVSDGGVLVALAEMAMASGIGARMMTHPRDIPGHAFWFGEDQARYLVAVPDHVRLRPHCRGGRDSGCAPRHLRRAGFDTAGWRLNIHRCLARGA